MVHHQIYNRIWRFWKVGGGRGCAAQGYHWDNRLSATAAVPTLFLAHTAHTHERRRTRWCISNARCTTDDAMLAYILQFSSILYLYGVSYTRRTTTTTQFCGYGLLIKYYKFCTRGGGETLGRHINKACSSSSTWNGVEPPLLMVTTTTTIQYIYL